MLALKGNQGTLCEEVRTLLNDPGLSGQQAQEIDAGHGRIETREARLVTEIAWLQEQHAWPGLACVGKITTTREDKAQGAVQSQTRYYLLSRIMPVQEFLNLVRAHGSVENSPALGARCGDA